MGFATETRQTADRFKKYIDQLIGLCKAHGLSGWKAPLTIVTTYRKNSDFRNKWNQILADVRTAEGGKLTFATVGMIIGLVLGGVGIAAGGGAIGIPLVAVLTPLGFLAGQETDALGITGSTKKPQNANWSGDDQPSNDLNLPGVLSILESLQSRISEVEFRSTPADLHAALAEVRKVHRELIELHSSVSLLNISWELKEKKLDAASAGVSLRMEAVEIEYGSLKSKLAEFKSFLDEARADLTKLSSQRLVERCSQLEGRVMLHREELGQIRKTLNLLVVAVSVFSFSIIVWALFLKK